jgi:glycosyltransferase involved in cell wall biosynthesis
MALLEAMALGKPVVAIDVGGVRDAVEDGETGLLVRGGYPAEFAGALLRLAGDRVYAARLGARGRERQLTRFSSDRMVDDYARLFESVAGRRARPMA